jgi:hypothetical protein
LFWLVTSLGGNVLIRIFLFGILLGIAVAAGGLYALPVVDQHREMSYVSVAPNGGNGESFHINIPDDRVMAGAAGQKSGLPIGMEWPQGEIFSGISAEIFKIRNERDVVVGVGARAAVTDEDNELIDWVLHLPARGTLFVNMEAAATENGGRIGRVKIGSDEFEGVSGYLASRWVPNTSGEEDAPAGRIELLATYFGAAEPSE